MSIFFLKDVYKGSKYFPTLLETVGLRVPNRNFRGFSLFIVDFKNRNCLSARCASAVNTIGCDTLIYSMVIRSRLMIGYYLIFLLEY
jgi:hypothetical protein